MSAQEAFMAKDFENFFVLTGKKDDTVSSKFKEGAGFRYQTLSKNDFGICYTLSGDYFVFTSSSKSIEEVLKRLE